MTYDFRNRKRKANYIDSSSSLSEKKNDSGDSDPDYTRTRRKKKTQQKNKSSNSIQITDTKTEEGGVVRRGRPPKRRANGEGEAQTSQKRAKRKRKQASNSRPSELKRNIFSWLIDLHIVRENEKIFYMDESHSRVLLEGTLTRGGVVCKCCQNEISVHEFERHAGSDARRPYDNIFVPNVDSSLLELQIKAWHCNEEVTNHGFNLVQPKDGANDRNDDACIICADGGDLVCCERCPSTFHPNCMEMERIPQGDWLCPFCVCKYCNGGDGELNTCSQCERKYHWTCFRERELLDLNDPSSSFCGGSCSEIHEKLQKMVGVKNELDGVLSWTLVRVIEPGSSLFSDDIHRSVQCNSNVAVAWAVMNECFLPNMDRHTGINLVQSVVYNRGSNLTRINFSGFYTAILEIGDEIISAASLRIHGPKLAEMPYIATCEKYRLNGMSRKLMLAIESALRFLNVENLVIPSVADLATMWIGKYQFSHVQDSLKKDILQCNTLMFPRTIRLQKTLLVPAPEPVVANNRVMEVAEEQNNKENQELVREHAARMAHIDLNLEPPPPLLDLNQEPPEDNEVLPII